MSPYLHLDSEDRDAGLVYAATQGSLVGVSPACSRDLTVHAVNSLGFVEAVTSIRETPFG